MENFKKRSAIIFLSVALIMGFGTVAGADSGQQVPDVLDEIRSSQSVGNNSGISCDKVSDEQFERLGDAYMDVMHPYENQHELMDRMMGGEGSDSLRAAHIMMGQRYLGCGDYSNSSYYGGMMGGMGGYGMMGKNGYGMMGGNYQNNSAAGVGNMMGSSGYGNMMGGTGFFGFGLGWIFMILFWGLIIWAIIAAIRGFSGRTGTIEENSALEILKERYAKGEIDKKEFEEKKSTLK